VGPQLLGGDYEFIWMDGQSNHSSSVDLFFQAISIRSSLNYLPTINKNESLINFEDSVVEHPRTLVVIINEFEILTDQNHQIWFNIEFYNTLRLLAEQGYLVLLTTSLLSLKILCKDVLGVSSPFYNIFQQIELKHFSNDEANGFLSHSHNGVTLLPNEIDFIKKEVIDYRHPLVLQIACDAIYKNRQDDHALELVKQQIGQELDHFLSHEEVEEGRRRMKDNDQVKEKTNNSISKPIDLVVSILIPVIGILLLMIVFGLLIRSLSNFQAVLLGLVTSILGFVVLIFAGRSIDIIGETTFYNLFLRMIEQIPLLSNLANSIIQLADRISENRSPRKNEQK
jgi:hypothetical protein